MTTSKEEQPISEESYSNEDQKLIVSLLDEYSKKLLNVCREINKIRFISITLIPLILVGFIAAVFNWSSTRFLVDFKLSQLVVTLITSILLFLCLCIACFNIVKTEMKLLVRDASVLSLKLEKVIRVASQVQEHGLSNFVSQLELDLRLTDAELALQHYTDLLKTTKRSFFRFFVQ